MNVHFSSLSVDWATPQGLYDQLNKEFNFNCDPCPLGGVEYMNGLEMELGTSTFCNPPYGKEISRWTSKAVEEANKGKTIVLLIPSRTDTKWFQNDIMKAKEIRFIKGRLKFGGSKTSAPFPSAIAIFN